jgi:5-methylcytosine-specific restriction endonuclease McrA
MKAPKTRGHKKALLAVPNPRCGICGAPIDNPDTVTIDHIIPLSKGGTNHRYNVQLAHGRCNRKKADSVPRLSQRNAVAKKEALNLVFKDIDSYLEAAA